MRRLFFLMSGLAVILLVLVGAPVVAQVSTTPPRLVFQTTIPGVSSTKFPDVATAGRTVWVAGNTDTRNAFIVSKADSSQTFGPIEVLGLAPGQPDYSPVSVATGPDGAVHVAWLNQETRQLLYRTKPAGGVFSAQRIIATSGGFPASINIGVASDGAIYIAYRLVDAPHRVFRLANSNAVPTGPYLIGSTTGSYLPMMAPGPNGQLALAYTSGEGGYLQVYLALWNGSGFTTQRASLLGENYADPSVTYDADGNLLMAWRGIENEGGSGLWLGTYQGNNQWQVNRLTDRSGIIGIPNLLADAQGNLHLSWISIASGAPQVYYAFKPKGGSFSTPITSPNPGGSIFNPQMAVNIGDEIYAHVVIELFDGSGLRTRYYLFATPAKPAVDALPTIENGAMYTERTPTVQVLFTAVKGEPVEIRWRWGAAPDDANDDSAGWQSFPATHQMDISVPDRILTNATCAPVALYTQVQDVNGSTSKVESDDIIFDVGVTALAVATNPYYRYRSSTFTQLASMADLTMADQATVADVSADGASDGAPGYTRVPVTYIEVRGLSECSGLESFSRGTTSTALTQPLTITNNMFANVLGYPGVMGLGANQFVLHVVDKVGNMFDYPQVIYYDPIKPILTISATDSFSVTSDPSATILSHLTVKNVTVQDAYPGRGFWGVWVANSRTPVAQPSTDSSLVWTPIEVPGNDTSFSLPWSLASGLSADKVSPGSYYVYLRFLDGAGNPTDQVLSSTVSLSQVTRPKTHLPLIRR